MPELPEVEVLVRHLAPVLVGRRILGVDVRRRKVLGQTTASALKKALAGSKFVGLSRRGKYLLFALRKPNRAGPLFLLGHLGMTGRMYLKPAVAPLAKHAAVVLNLGEENFVFEDTRYFGKFTLDLNALEKLGPEPLGAEFTCAVLGLALKRSSQAVKIKLLDQSVIAGVGNIYASEALFRAGIAPAKPARGLTPAEVRRLWRALRAVLRNAIRCGSTVPLNYAGDGQRDGLFYFGRAAGTVNYYAERLRVYDRAGQACHVCGTTIQRLLQAARSTYDCPRCQRR